MKRFLLFVFLCGVSLQTAHAETSREQVLQQRKEYGQALDICRARKAMGEKLTCPTISDTKLIRALLDGTELKATKPAAPTTNVTSSLTTDQLSDADRLALRKYTRAGVCPESLKDYALEGFYDLCVSLTGKSAKTTPVKGLLRDTVLLRMNAAPGKITVQKRLNQLSQGKGIVRERKVPLRPVRLTTEKVTTPAE